MGKGTRWKDSYVESVDFDLPLRFQRRDDQLVDPGGVLWVQPEVGEESAVLQLLYLSDDWAGTPVWRPERNGRGWCS